MTAFFMLFSIFASILHRVYTSSNTSSPHIVIILADDLGWNDVSFHGSDQIPTPNIDALAYNGIILNSHYVPALCTPSRAALLTGKYPTSLGMQHLVILMQEPWGLPLEEKLLPEYLRDLGYKTHAIGKWHLGFHKKIYTPLYRGFDSFFGYYNGFQDYYTHDVEAKDGEKGYDMRRGLDVDIESRGKYTTDALTEEAVKIILDKNPEPMFLYMAHLAPHYPFQAPDKEIARFSQIKDPKRRVYGAMVTKLDESVGKIMTALRQSGKLENSIVIFMSDNGAVTHGTYSNQGSNFPLRGMKETPWEGGVRGVATIWSPLLKKIKRVSNQLMHSSDWLPTLLSAAGYQHLDLRDIDGYDMWNSLSNDLPSPRKEIFHNYDEIEQYSSLRVGPWKYIEGTVLNGELDSWYGDTGKEYQHPPYNMQLVLSSEANVAIVGHLTELQLQNYRKAESPKLLTAEKANLLRKSSQLTCSSSMIRPKQNVSHLLFDEMFCQGVSEKINKSFSCDPRKEACLFHIEKDPCEEMNVAGEFPEILEQLKAKLTPLKKKVKRPLNVPADPKSHPSLHNGIWTHWCDE